jgi:hypothetical protein
MRAGRRPAATRALALSCALAALPAKATPAMTAPGDAAASMPAGGQIAVGPDEARAIAAALRHFLDTDPTVKSLPMFDATSAGRLFPGDTPFLDAQGLVRIGGWLLQARGAARVLTWREPGAPRWQYVASVCRVDAHAWRVTAVAWERILPR